MARSTTPETEDSFEDPHPEKRKGEPGKDLAKMSSRSVDVGGQVIDVKELRQLSFADMMAAFPGATALASEVIETDQFGVLLDKENKALLVRVPFIIVKWDFYPGDFGEFVSAWVITQKDDRYILNDGSTGIFAQLKELTDRTGRKVMLGCPKGLRVSEYDYTLPNGTVTRAKTFYIDLSL